MIIAVDFDSTIILPMADASDPEERLRLVPGAKVALHLLRKAGHVLLLWSARSNRALRFDWRLNPLWTSGAVPFHEARWQVAQPLYQARFRAMVELVNAELPGIFAAIDDGWQGKPVVDVFIDDRAFGAPLGRSAGIDWARVVARYGRQPIRTAKARLRGIRRH